MAKDIWGGMLIETVSGGGYMVREWCSDPSSYARCIFACSSKDELLKFIGFSLVTTDVQFPALVSPQDQQK